MSSLFGTLDTTKLDKVDVVDPSTATEDGKAADAKSTYEELNRISGMASDAKEIAESKADKATTLAGYGITDAATKVELASKADLVDGKVPAAQLPSFVDDVLEYDAMSSFPATGEDGKIYIDKETNKTYRWSGTQYIEISQSLALGETESTAYPGDKGKVASETAFAAYNVANQMTSAIVVHTENKSNPHAVTAEQINAYTKAEADAKFREKADLSLDGWVAGDGAPDGISGQPEWIEEMGWWCWSWTDPQGTFESFVAWNSVGPDEPGPITLYDELDPYSDRSFTATRDRIAKKSDVAEVINVAIAGKLSKSDVVAPSGDSREGQAADAKVVRAELDSILSLADRAQTDANTALYDIGETKAALDNIKITAEDALWATERLENNKVQTLKLEDDSVKTSAENGVAKLDDFFTNADSFTPPTEVAGALKNSMLEKSIVLAVTENFADADTTAYGGQN